MPRIYCGIREIPKGSRLGSPEECAKRRQVRLYGLHKINADLIKLVKKVVVKKTKPTAWTTHVKKYAIEHGITYREALTKAKPSYNKNALPLRKLPPIKASRVLREVEQELKSILHKPKKLKRSKKPKKPKKPKKEIYRLKVGEVPVFLDDIKHYIKADQGSRNALQRDTEPRFKPRVNTYVRIVNALEKRNKKFDKSEQRKFLNSPVNYDLNK